MRVVALGIFIAPEDSGDTGDTDGTPGDTICSGCTWGTENTGEGKIFVFFVFRQKSVPLQSIYLWIR